MQKGKLIQTYIGEDLGKLGFTYGGRKGDSWIFEKKIKEIKQTISFYEYRFEKNMISFDLYTNARGRELVQAVMIDGLSFNSDLEGFWKYEDEASFIEILKQMKEIILKKGIKILGKLSIPEEIDATDEMFYRLYTHHEELAKEYQEEHNILVTGYDQENIDRWFSIIGEEFNELRKGEYDEYAKEFLVKVAAFLGDTLIRYKGGRWERCIFEDSESCSVEGIKSNHESGINILGELVGGYGWNGIEWVKESYEELID